MSNRPFFGIDKKSYDLWKKSDITITSRTIEETLSDPKTWEKVRELASRPMETDLFFVSPQAWDSLVEYQKLENKWKKLPKHLYNQRWLRYNLKNKHKTKRTVKILPLP